MTRKFRMAGSALPPVLAVTFIAALGAVGASSKPCTNCTADSTKGMWQMCGTPTPTLREMVAIEAEVGRDIQPLASTVAIPVYFHIILTDAGEGDVADALFTQQIDIMNAAFSGAQAPGGYNTQYRFTLAGISRTVNNAWYAAGYGTPAEIEMKTALRQGSADDMNI